MNNQLHSAKQSKRSTHPNRALGYLKQYIIQGPSQLCDNIDLFSQVGTVLNKHDTLRFNRGIMKNLNHLVIFNMLKNESSIGLSFTQQTEVDVWDADGELLYTWDPEINTVFNIYVHYVINHQNRMYIRTNEGSSFILDGQGITLEYDLK